MAYDQFQAWPKIARLRRGDMVVTEKIDGAPTQVTIRPLAPGASHVDAELDTRATWEGRAYAVRAGSRRRFVSPGRTDVYGFAAWVRSHAPHLVEYLGTGRHYGEWYGQGIGRGYGMDTKRWALFNTTRWMAPESDCLVADPIAELQDLGAAVDVVPILYRGPWSDAAIDACLSELREQGSALHHAHRAPAEGVVVYHRDSNHLFKVTLDQDLPKGHAIARADEPF